MKWHPLLKVLFTWIHNSHKIWLVVKWSKYISTYLVLPSIPTSNRHANIWMLSFETKITIHNRGRIKTTMSTTFDCHWTIMESWQDAETLTFCRRHNIPALLFSKSIKEVLHVEEALISNNVTNYGNRSVFLIYYLTTPMEKNVVYPICDRDG